MTEQEERVARMKRAGEEASRLMKSAADHLRRAAELMRDEHDYVYDPGCPRCNKRRAAEAALEDLYD